MNAPAPSPPDAEAQAWLQALAGSMTRVLGQIAGAEFPVETPAEPPADAAPPDRGDSYIVLTAVGGLRGEASLRLPQTAVLSLAQLLLSEAQDRAAEFKPEHREAAEELIRQIAGQTATALAGRWGEVQLRAELAEAPSWAAGLSGWIVSPAGAPAQFWLEWQLSASLLAALRAAPGATAAAKGEEANPEAGESATLVSAGKLDLLMDVELDVTLRFGGRRMRLREILELGPGSVVELDRQVQEPADLLLDGRLIARGEVVVVDGNYGLRVLEVISSPPLPGSGS